MSSRLRGNQLRFRRVRAAVLERRLWARPAPESLKLSSHRPIVANRAGRVEAAGQFRMRRSVLNWNVLPSLQPTGCGRMTPNTCV